MGPYRLEAGNVQIKEEHIHLRFQAVVIASQLPDDRAEALLVLDYARQMVVEFLDDSSGVSDSVSAPSRATGLPCSDPWSAGPTSRRPRLARLSSPQGS